MAGVKFVYHLEAEHELVTSGAWRERVQQIGDMIADDARRHAPVGSPSHGGAASITAVTSLGPAGWETRVSWDRAHYYMKFPESGTRYQPARPFLRPALDRVRGRI